jgi:hypothetical protein
MEILQAKTADKTEELIKYKSILESKEVKIKIIF